MDFWNIKAFIVVVIISGVGVFLIRHQRMERPRCCRFFPLFVMNTGLMVAIVFALLGIKDATTQTVGPMLSTAFLIILYSAIVSLLAMIIRNIR